MSASDRFAHHGRVSEPTLDSRVVIQRVSRTTQDFGNLVVQLHPLPRVSPSLPAQAFDHPRRQRESFPFRLPHPTSDASLRARAEARTTASASDRSHRLPSSMANPANRGRAARAGPTCRCWGTTGQLGVNRPTNLTGPLSSGPARRRWSRVLTMVSEAGLAP